MRWTHQVPRDVLSASTRNTLGAIQTLFKLGSDVAHELNHFKVAIGVEAPYAPSAPQPSADEVEEAAQVRAENIERADEFIEDAIGLLGPYEVQDLVAGILRAMGYRTVVSTPGPDRGVDIFASPDGLGLLEPRIFVEVKHHKRPIGAKESARSSAAANKETNACSSALVAFRKMRITRPTARRCRSL